MPKASDFFAFTPYDVLQICRHGEWLDFATLRTDDDALRAVALVDAAYWDGQPATFRICAFKQPRGEHIKYS